METPTSSHTTIAKKVLHMLKIAYYVLRKGISKHKLTMDLHLLLKRGKLAGKFIITNLIHHHAVSSSSSPYSSLSCKFMDPDTAYYNPRREVEFSCSNTPRISKKKARRDDYSYETHQAAAILRALEMMNMGDHELRHSPALGFGRSPRVVRQLRVTDSPFPVIEEEVVDDDERVDKEAEEFIRRFYEELRMQERTAVATPEYCSRFSPRG